MNPIEGNGTSGNVLLVEAGPGDVRHEPEIDRRHLSPVQTKTKPGDRLYVPRDVHEVR